MILIRRYCFGSYASKTQKNSSDIDICLISDDKILKEEINKKLRLLPQNTHLNEFTSEEFIEMIITKKDNVGKEILKNYAILQGIENFHRLIKNA